jgi:AcrR family transcriptional regulator
MPHRTSGRGARTRDAILRTAADVASVEGLQGLTIGRLGEELGMSKSGLFAHFGSKEGLQLATIEAARQRYVEAVLDPARISPPGITRLLALCESFLSYVEQAVFPGGCFFAAAMAEFDSRAPSPVRDLIAECQEQWMSTLERAVAQAQEDGQIAEDTDPKQLAFELEAILLAANSYFHLHGDSSYLDRARLATRTRLATAATAEGLRSLSAKPA